MNIRQLPRSDLRRPSTSHAALFLALAVLVPLRAAQAQAQVLGIAVDNKVRLVDGALQVVPSAPADYAAFYSWSGTQLVQMGQVPAPASFQGPPSAIAISRSLGLALVSSSFRLDAENPQKLAPDNRLSVIDIAASPMRVTQTLQLSAAPSSIALNAAGTLALAVHNSDDSVSMLSISDKTVTASGKRSFGKGSGPMAAAFSADGATVLISLSAAGQIAVFSVVGDRLSEAPSRLLSAGIWPTALSFCGRSGLAVVANYGKVTGDADTVSLLDLRGVPRVVDTATVGPSPEGVACSPDGRYVAAAVQNMSTVAQKDPLHSANSKLVLLGIKGNRLVREAEASIGPWAQGVAFLGDSRVLAVQSASARSVSLFRVRHGRLEPMSRPLVLEGAPVSIGVSEG